MTTVKLRLKITSLVMTTRPGEKPVVSREEDALEFLRLASAAKSEEEREGWRRAAQNYSALARFNFGARGDRRGRPRGTKRPSKALPDKLRRLFDDAKGKRLRTVARVYFAERGICNADTLKKKADYAAVVYKKSRK